MKRQLFTKKKVGAFVIGAAAMLTLGIWKTPDVIHHYQEKALAEQKAERLDKFSQLTPEEIKKMPKYDRPDLAALQDFEMTKDPALGYIPNERKVQAFKEVQNIAQSRAAISGVNWTERGPNNVGGRTRALMFDPNDSNNRKVWAAGVAGGIWFNSNITSSSTQWQNVNDFWSNIAVTTMAYDPTNTQTFYAGTGEGYLNADAVRGAGIWKSTNGGTSWSQLSSTNNSDFYYVQKVAVTSSGTLLASTRTGLFRSTNGGSSWSSVLSGVANDIEIVGSTIYVSKGLAGVSGSLHKSTNDGQSFSTITPTSGGERLEIAVAPSDANTLYVVASSGSNVAWFRKSTNGGSSWSTVTIPSYLEQGSCAAGSNDFTRGQAWYDLILAVHPTNPNIVLAGGIDIHRSTNGGSSWSSVTYWTGACGPYLHADQHAITFRPGSPNEAIFGNDGGVAYSGNVGSASSPSFNVRNNGYNVTQFYAVAMENSTGSNYMIAGAQDNGSHKFTTAGVNATSEVTGGDGAFCHIDQDNPNYQITSYVYNSYYRSTNGGSSFSSILNVSGRGKFINPTDYDSDANILYCSGNPDEFIRVSGITGTIGANALAVSFGGAQVSAVTVSPYTANRVFFGTDNGEIYRVDNADGSSPSATQISSSSFPANAYMSSIAVGSSDNQLLVTFSNYGVSSVWETRNGGSSWSNKDSNLPDIPVRSSLYNPNNTDEVMIATEAGIWSVDDVSASSPVWGVTNTGLANVRCDYLQIRDSDGLVAVATHGRGVYTADAFSGGTPPPPPTGCATTVSSFPYSESFESGTGVWSQSSGDDIDWTRDSGGTPSNNTGPSAAADGSWYMFVEASNPNFPSKSAIFEGPCFDLSGESNADFTFDYHMNGTDMGTLTLEAKPDGGSWSSVWTRSGNQGTAWNNASVDMNSYTGSSVQLRFVGTTGSGYTSDMTIDNLELSTVAPPAPCDVPAGLASSSVGETSFTLTWAAVSGAVSYDVDVNGTILNATTNSINVTGATAGTTYTCAVRTNCSSTSSAYSASIQVTTDTPPPPPPTGGCTGGIASFPYSESFESGLGAWTNGTGDDNNWTRDSGGTPSNGTGPSTGSAGSWYMYLETSGNGTGYPNKTAYLNSPCFDLSGESSATFSFDYHMNGTAVGSLQLQVSDDDGSSWSNAWSISGSQGNAWNSVDVDFAAYTGGSVQARFLATSGSGWSSDIAVDNIGVSASGGGTGGTPTTVTLTLVTDNYGSETTWTLTDGSGSTVASGSGYGNNQTYTENFNLPAGCYDFTINDSYGDGICCSYGNGSYALTEGGSTLASGGNFASTETKNFCVGGSVANMGIANNTFDKEFAKPGVSVYPNPANNQLNVSISGFTEKAKVAVFDMNGRQVMTLSASDLGRSIDISNLDRGIFIVRVTEKDLVLTERFVKVQ